MDTRPEPGAVPRAADDEMPLDRDEEIARRLRRPAPTPGADGGIMDLLFRTRLRDLNPRPAITVPRGTTVAGACGTMRDHRIGCLLVMDGPAIAGIFTERDVLYKVACAGSDPGGLLVDAVMTPNPTTLRPGHRLAHALNKMSVDGCRHVPLVGEDGRPVGVVSVRRIVDFLVEQFPERLLNLPPDPDQEMDTREGG